MLYFRNIYLVRGNTQNTRPSSKLCNIFHSVLFAESVSTINQTAFVFEHRARQGILMSVIINQIFVRVSRLGRGAGGRAGGRRRGSAVRRNKSASS